jgi:hypothetical protein
MMLILYLLHIMSEPLPKKYCGDPDETNVKSTSSSNPKRIVPYMVQLARADWQSPGLVHTFAMCEREKLHGIIADVYVNFFYSHGMRDMSVEITNESIENFINRFWDNGGALENDVFETMIVDDNGEWSRFEPNLEELNSARLRLLRSETETKREDMVK